MTYSFLSSTRHSRRILSPTKYVFERYLLSTTPRSEKAVSGKVFLGRFDSFFQIGVTETSVNLQTLIGASVSKTDRERSMTSL